ncbi:MAG: hypothetical protein NT094_00825 [Candidatus Staskawiczbacteria bacterium]|nr:hypothetical protein [Candidatus Staskawiczbacteria bacterium]
MPWQIPVFLSMLVGRVIAPIIIKNVASAPSRTRNLVWQYFFAALLASLTALISGDTFSIGQSLIVASIGFFNAFACYCQWRAINISLSKTSLFTQADDLICLLLGYAVLGEGKILNLYLIIGIILCLGSALLFVWQKPAKDKGVTPNNKIWLWIALYSIIWGVAIFSMRFFSSVDGMSLPAFAFSWYIGSLIGAGFVFLLGGKKEAGMPLKPRQIGKVSILAFIIWISLSISYWARSIAPLTIIQPIDQVAEMILPTIVGLWIFKESANLSRLSQIAILLGLTGGMIIVFGY